MDEIKASASRFVSGGSIEKPNERDAEWLAAEQALEDERVRKHKIGKEHDGKSLYEVLQANKEAKQAEFEESMKLKNQFRPLDDDEIEFLDSVTKSSREKDRAFQQETENQLDVFRKQQNEVERKARAGDSQAASNQAQEWEFSGKKRKKADDRGGLKGIKLRRTAQESVQDAKALDSKAEEPLKKSQPESLSSKESQPAEKPVESTGLGLGNYGSDSDE